MNTEKLSILLCEPDASFGLLLSEFLSSKGYITDLVSDGELAWQHFQRGGYDLCICEFTLPQLHGLELVRNIRTESDIPIFFFTSKDTAADILAGYKAGADDYLIKPCSMEIVLCKIASIMRRIRKRDAIQQTQFQLGHLYFDANHQYLQTDDEMIRLSSRESDLLQMLSQHPNQLVERSYILKTIWKNDSYFCTRSLSVYINHLRKYLQLDPNIKIISVHGKGYKLVLPS